MKWRERSAIGTGNMRLKVGKRVRKIDGDFVGGKFKGKRSVVEGKGRWYSEKREKGRDGRGRG